MPFKSHATRVRIHTVQRRDWRDYRDIRLAAMRVPLSACGSRGHARPLPGGWVPLGKSPATKDCEGSGQ